MLYNFRFDRSHPVEIMRRLQQERILSQGWGGGADGRLRITDDDFVARCRALYSLPTTRIATNLTRIREFKDGDLLVVPHLPAYGKASIHLVQGDFPGCYVHRDPDLHHLNHGIRVSASYGLGGEISIYNHLLASWRGRLPAYRLPIVQLAPLESVFRALVRDLADHGMVLPESTLDEHLGMLLCAATQEIKVLLAPIAPAGGGISFESVCEYLLLAWGYRVVARHEYDGQGGDVDLRCVRQRTDLTPFETGEVTLLVQVKKYSGSTGTHAVQQLVNWMKDNDGDGCVMSLGDDFAPDAVELAERHGITLMDGDTICRLLLAKLTNG
jgi:Restriction endonuclease